jgi:hypothetical protein
MFLLELFATMTARRRSTHRHDEEGVEITRRLLELLDATKLKQVDTLSAIPVNGSLLQSQTLLKRKER